MKKQVMVIHKVLYSLPFLILLALSYPGLIQQASGDPSLSYIAFLRNEHLWVMRADGSEQRQITSHSVGSFSVSDNGRVVYDSFDPIGSKTGPPELNIYYIDNFRNGQPKRLTSDNQTAWPVLSPDGRQVVVQKFKWAGKRNYEGDGLGLWLIDLESGKHEPLAEVVKIPDEIRKKRDTLFAELGRGGMDEKKWLYDSEVIWAPRGDRVIFSRTFKEGGIVTFCVDLASRVTPKALPEKFVTALDYFGDKVVVADNIIEYRLITLDLEGGRETTLVKPVFVDSAEFSPDGTQIAYYTPPDSAGDEGLWLIPSNGGKRTQLLSGGNEIGGRLTWNTDGKTLLFERSNYETGEQEVWSVGRDGSPLVRLAQNASQPRWISKP